jgi:hypothetical protein
LKIGSISKTWLHKTVLTSYVLISFTGLAHGATYYVSTIGNDANTGSQSAPFRHLSRGAAAAQAGDTVIVMDGIYDNEGQVATSSGGGSVVTVTNAGAPGNPITIMAQNRGSAILDAASSTQSSLGCYGAWAYFDVSYTSYVVIQGFVIENACLNAVHINGNAHDITVKWNEIRNIGNWNTPAGTLSPTGSFQNSSEYNITFDGNIFHDIGGGTNINQQHAIYSYSSNLTVINNIFYNQVHGWDIQLAGGSNVYIANNTFAFANPNRDGQILLWNSGPLSNIVIENNIFYQPPSNAIVSYLSGGNGPINGCTFQYNLTTAGSIWDNGSSCTLNNNVTASDPMFVNASTAPYDFHLKSGSPAIDTGMTVPYTNVDLDNWTRPFNFIYDRGAYEYHTSQPTQSTILLSATPGSFSMVEGATVTGSITATVTGTASPTFSASGLPAGVSASFSPANCTGSCTTTLTITAAGPYQGTGKITIAATSGTLAATTSVGLTIAPPPISSVAPPPISSVNYTTGLVGRWKLLGDATDSVAGNNGTLHGGAIWSTSTYNGVSFPELRFNGSTGYVSIAERQSLEMSNQLTVSFWVCSAPSSNSDPRVVAKIYDWDVKLNENLYPQFTSGSKYAITNYPLPTNVWTHIVFTFSSGTVNAYVNGQAVGFQSNTFTSMSTLPSYAYGLELGANVRGTRRTLASSTGSFYSGGLSDVSIYNRALTANEVAALYAAYGPGATPTGAPALAAIPTPLPTPVPTTTPIPPAPPVGDYSTGLVARWKLLGSATDSVTGTTGTLHGGAIWSNSTYNSVSFTDLQLDGTSGYVSIPESSQLELTTQLTVSFWLQSTSNSNPDARVVAKVYDWFVKLNNHDPQFSAGSDYAITNYYLPSDTWAHVVFTLSSGTVNAYVNGQPVGFQTNTFTSASVIPNYAYGLYLGTDSSSSYFYGGGLSDVRIYNRALSANDVAALYAGVTPASLK